MSSPIQTALSAYVEKNVTEKEGLLTESELAGMPGIRSKLGKGPNDPVYRKDIFQLLVR